MKIGTLFYCICFIFNLTVSAQVEKNRVFMIEPGLNVVTNSYKDEYLFFRKAPGFEISLRYQQYKEKKLGIGFTAHTYFNHNKPSIENLLLFTQSDDTVIVHGNYWSIGASAGIMPFIQFDKHLMYVLYENSIGAIHYPN